MRSLNDFRLKTQQLGPCRDAINLQIIKAISGSFWTSEPPFQCLLMLITFYLMFFSYTGEGKSVAPRLVRAMGETDLRSTNEAAHTHNASFDHTI